MEKQAQNLPPEIEAHAEALIAYLTTHPNDTLAMLALCFAALEADPAASQMLHAAVCGAVATSLNETEATALQRGVPVLVRNGIVAGLVQALDTFIAETVHVEHVEVRRRCEAAKLVRSLFDAEVANDGGAA